MLGVPLPEFLDFVGDAGVGAGLSSDGLWLGMAGEVTDERDRRGARRPACMTILRLFGAVGREPGIAIETTMVGGVEVTTITLPIDEMMAESGLPVPIGDTISVAVADGHAAHRHR